MGFMAGDSEMARLTRAFDWSTHPFGPPSGWPTPLRAAYGICLNSAFPTAIYWGPELRLLYNDAWSSIPGPRHPAAFGAPAREVWADIWHIIEPQFREVYGSGSGLFLQDQLLPMRRYGFEEETYWNYSFTPIRDETGLVTGIFNSGSETTEHVLQRRRAEFLLTLSDEFRQAVDEMHILRAGLRGLGEYLRAARVVLLVRSGTGEEAVFEAQDQWTSGDFARLERAVDVPTLGAWGRELLQGRIVRLDNGVARRDADAAFLCGAEAMVTIPWMRGGRVDAVLTVHSVLPRRWTDVEVTTAEDVLNRMQTWIERQRAIVREQVMSREIDHRARNLLSVVRSILRLTRADDAETLREKASDRILSLSRTHTLLSRKRWRGVTLGELIEQDLEPYGGGAGKISLSGPAVPLSPERAQSVAMVLHELATNAAKHGALSGEGGALSVTWETLADGMVAVAWRECVDLAGARAVEDPGTGFGSTLLPLVVEGQLSGTLERDLGESGLTCRITFLGTPPAE
jgi:two-component sensor histidine kinase